MLKSFQLTKIFPSSVPAGTTGPRIYRVGTLTYTRGALIQVMFWMLWGDFFLQLMEALSPSVIPLQLRWAGAGDTLIGVLNNSLPSVLGFFLMPVIGLQSDHHRGRLGRRRPFLLWCTPPVVLSLVLLGAATPAGALLQRGLSALGLGAAVTTAGCTIAWIGLCILVYVTFNYYVLLAYQYMFADVIPPEVMGKFVGLYRAVGAIGGLAFNRWVLGWVEAHTFHVYSLLALLYASAFYLLVWRVKEGEYPPPPPRGEGGRLGALSGYLRECFSHRFYLCYYGVTFFYYGSLPALAFVIFFATKAGQPGYAPTLGLTLEEFGRAKGWTFLIQIPVFLLVGPLIDRFHGLRLSVLGLFLTSGCYFGCFWFIHGAASLLLWWGLTQAAIAIYTTSLSAAAPRLLPREQYGQFLSANATLGFVTLMAAPPLIGWLFETIRDYRYLYVVCGTSTALACLLCVALFLQWKKLGGDQSFTPPASSRGEPGVTSITRAIP